MFSAFEHKDPRIVLVM